jgi:cytochrome oxidase assembly protein ShyY1
MLRTALRPRWLALLALVLLAATGMSLLGRWQLDRAKEHGAQEQQKDQAAVRPIEDVITPRATFLQRDQGAHVSATGQWDGDRRVLIPGRELKGQQGFWVLVPLKLSDGSAVGVVRGWVPSVSDPAAAPPSGGVTVTGLLHPTEVPVDRAPGQGSGLPPGQLETIAITDLINLWPYPLITGYVAAETESPPSQPAPQRLPRPVADTGLDWLNVGYAIQWWLFAGFAFFMWWRIVRDDHQQNQQSDQGRPPRRGGPSVGEDEGDQSQSRPLAEGVAP